MLRFLILFLLVWLVLHMLERGLRRLAASGSAGQKHVPSGAGRGGAARSTAGGRSPARDLLVACATCGIRFPTTGSPSDGEPVYCSERCRIAHRQGEDSVR